ncbi:RagB/SusD family nutrient uptake outer membrane protein [Subsaximicrobium wynnwilliamsii]|uniref:RagB/SusD family nutrient uptake outer membrane protein n=1 Tax=Subsaximicrobium wynnwilliamsii TaxID=291179 RepID=A0A5C6ZA25_9FLAO|nr:RagB/SusD family nutrient uptake outer membrane protein [Subsaximicrobium wynnwilliamsii]TXD83140.1 RagB/SusD family nutrient uptake outer membrane protein [Subsaximicrobium wynnwilliamsii]TXD86712.1 RagB/SusD family nutrient uptake outer membrane protein [Subsaximicrobium wynnwilliamsii]TXE02974.1 RagB/SusD family nutrient uptake outer membrane protein [Subsaximicrobium wynnwilliamsii]
MKNTIKFLTLSVLTISFSCTDLEIEQTDSAFDETLSSEFQGVDPATSLDGIYNDLRGQIQGQEGLYALNEVSSDELLVPTRGTDWGDNGVWRNLHDHNWNPLHRDVVNTWNSLNQNVFKATLIIDPRSNSSAQQVAEAKFLRAFSTFWIADLYGQAPFRTPDEGAGINPSVKTRAEAFDFAVQDLTEALPDLLATGPSASLNRASKASANFLLAKLYLNRNVLSGTAVDAADMTKVVQYVNAIQDDGFALQSGYFDIFEDTVDSETILFTTSEVGPRIWNTLHYKQNSPDNEGGGWNGFTTLSEFYDTFEGDPNINEPGSGQEERRGYVPTDGSNLGIGYGFLIGQQYDETGTAMTDRVGNPLDFTRELPGLLGNDEVTGIRVIKYHPENGGFTGHQIVFRYADAHLMKAEAILRGATSSETALSLVNELRAMRNLNGNTTPLTAVSEQNMLDERGRELYGEFWRRNDQIRFGKFSEPWQYKSNTDAYRVLFPIPATAIISNPNLVQNEGY